jgi:hypothetical protein
MERRAQLPITPLFDRSKPGVSKSQVAFMDVVAVPLYRALAKAFPATEPMLKGVRVTLWSCIATIAGIEFDATATLGTGSVTAT